MTPEKWYVAGIFANQPRGAVHPVRNAPTPLITGTSRRREDQRKEPRFAVNQDASLRVLDPLSLTPVPVTVVEVSQSGMKLRLPMLLPVGTTVQVHLAAAIALGEVRHSEKSKDDFFAGIILRDVCPTGPGRDSRQEARYPVNVPGSVRIQGSAMETCEISVLDVSKSGLRIRSPKAIPEGTQVDVESSGATITGEIRYVRTLEEGGFNMGIRAYSANEAEGRDGALDLTVIFYPEVTS